MHTGEVTSIGWTEAEGEVPIVLVLMVNGAPQFADEPATESKGEMMLEYLSCRSLIEQY